MRARSVFFFKKKKEKRKKESIRRWIKSCSISICQFVHIITEGETNMDEKGDRSKMKKEGDV